MLRRRKDAILNGKPLIELPPREVNVLECEFDDEERAFYQALAEKIESTLEKFAKSAIFKPVLTHITENQDQWVPFLESPTPELDVPYPWEPSTRMFSITICS